MYSLKTPIKGVCCSTNTLNLKTPFKGVCCSNYESNTNTIKIPIQNYIHINTKVIAKKECIPFCFILHILSISATESVVYKLLALWDEICTEIETIFRNSHSNLTQ